MTTFKMKMLSGLETFDWKSDSSDQWNVPIVVLTRIPDWPYFVHHVFFFVYYQLLQEGGNTESALICLFVFDHGKATELP
jgi:hypothetical protein